MYKILLAVSFFDLCTAQPYDLSTVVEYVYDDVLENYNFRYRTSDDTFQGETGEFINEGPPEENYIVNSKSEWQAPNGDMYELVYVTDKYGCHPILIKLDTGISFVPPETLYPQLPQTVRLQQPVYAQPQYPLHPQHPLYPQPHRVHPQPQHRVYPQPHPVHPQPQHLSRPQPPQPVRPQQQPAQPYIQPLPAQPYIQPLPARPQNTTIDSPNVPNSNTRSDFGGEVGAAVPGAPQSGRIGAGTTAALLG